MSPAHLFMPERNTPLGQVVKGHLDVDFVARKDANAVLTHFSRRMRKHFVTVVQFDPEHGIGENFRNNAFKFK